MIRQALRLVALSVIACLGLGPSALAQPFATVINVPGDQNSISGTIGSDTQLNVTGTPNAPFFDIAPGFNAGAFDGSSSNVEVNISGGAAGDQFNANAGSTVNLSGGFGGVDFNARPGSVVNVTGGGVGIGFHVFGGATANVSGGFVAQPSVQSGGVLNLSGGQVVYGATVQSGGELNVSGGLLGSVLNGQPDPALPGETLFDNIVFAEAGSSVTVFGSDFVVNGLPLAGAPGTVVEVVARDITVSGMLADGNAFSFDLNSTPFQFQPMDYFDPSATLTLVTVPEPSTLGALAASLLGFWAAREPRVRARGLRSRSTSPLGETSLGGVAPTELSC